jgi:hypothetical protein
MKPGRKPKRWRKYTKRTERVGTFIEDPLIRRVCPFCGRTYHWYLSHTGGGQEKRCATCNAIFCSKNYPSWIAP